MHITVLLDEVITSLKPCAGGRYLDVTVGGGGHSEGLLAESGPNGVVLGTDADASAIARSTERLAAFGSRVILRQVWMDQVPALAHQLGFVSLDGIVADLGLSSNQLADDKRGFSFMREGPLDMRFDASQGVSAADLINQSDTESLVELLQKYGEVDRARRVAEAIWKARPLTTTVQLRDVLSGIAKSRGRIHPATQVFQALRIAVNEELRRLSDSLPGLVDLLSPGGRLAVISFHSLEDRIVKRAFRDMSTAEDDQPGFGQPKVGYKPTCVLVNRKPIEPSEAEVAGNPRARSAKLRVIERIL